MSKVAFELVFTADAEVTQAEPEIKESE